jgi:hypothetical protein
MVCDRFGQCNAAPSDAIRVNLAPSTAWTFPHGHQNQNAPTLTLQERVGALIAAGAEARAG